MRRFLGTICGTLTKMNPEACLNRVRLLRSVLFGDIECVCILATLIDVSKRILYYEKWSILEIVFNVINFNLLYEFYSM